MKLTPSSGRDVICRTENSIKQLRSFSSSNHQVYVGLLSIFLLLWLHPALGEGRGVARGDHGELELGSEQVVGRKLEVGEVEGMMLEGEPDLGIKELEQQNEGDLMREGRELGLSEEEQEVAIMGEKQCLRRVVMEERRVPRQVFSEVIVIVIVLVEQGGDQVLPLHPQELPHQLHNR